MGSSEIKDLRTKTESSMLSDVFATAIVAVLACTGVYFAFLGLLTIPSLQSQVIYLNKVKLTWFKDVNIPEQWGFMPGQVTPFHLHTTDGETLHSWHILPPGLYMQHERELQGQPVGLAPDVRERLSFRLLRDDPQALLVVYLHGAAGTLASGHRPPSYRAISSLSPTRIHIIAIDYRGFGTSTGVPSEHGLLTDALCLIRFVTEEAGITPERIVLFSQSLGTAVATSLSRSLAADQTQPMFFKGLVMVAPFADVQTLTTTYKVAGTMPILSPLAKISVLLKYFHRFIWTHWPTETALADFVRICEESKDVKARYYVHIIHAKDDYDIPWMHSEQIYWSAVNATLPVALDGPRLEDLKETSREMMGAGGWIVHKQTSHGVLRQQIVEYGLHDWIMGYPIVGLAIARAFELDVR